VSHLDAWQEIVVSLKRHKLRTLMTAFGVFWGIFMLLLLLGAGKGIEKGVYADFGDITRNSFFMWGRQTQIPYKGLKPGRLIRLTNEDIKAIEQTISNTHDIVPAHSLDPQMVSYGDKNGKFDITGISEEAIHLRPLFMRAGRFLNAPDLKEKRKVAVIGRHLKEILFGKQTPIGLYININSVLFQVVGVYDLRTASGDEDELKKIYIPITTLQRVFHRGHFIDWFGMIVAKQINVSEVELKVKNFLKQRHKIAPQDLAAIGSWNAGKEFSKLQSLFRGIRVFVWLVGAGTILAGMVGVSNVMMIDVKERTREIGIRKALGATPFSIIRQILQESILITAVSGYMGLTASVLIIEATAHLMDKFHLESTYFHHPEINFSAAVTAIVILVITGAIAGFIPARQAAAINPIEALKE
jgi:putative ABC transport system permease protein